MNNELQKRINLTNTDHTHILAPLLRSAVTSYPYQRTIGFGLLRVNVGVVSGLSSSIIPYREA